MFNAEDRENVRELYVRYAYTVDEKNLDGCSNCFTEDAILEIRDGERFVGRDAIKKMLCDYWATLDGTQPRRHIMSNVSFHLDGETGRGTAYYQYYTVRNGVAGLAAIGTYQDELRKTSGLWQFAHRIVTFDTKSPM